MKQFLRAAVAAVVVVLAGFSSSLTAAGQDGLGTSQLRTSNGQIVEAFRFAYARSATFRELVRTIELSTDIVYLEAEGPQSRPFRSSLQLAYGKSPVRYWRIEFDVREPRRLVALLAHELQHATEVVVRPEIVDGRSLNTLYEGIGYRSCPRRTGECWETARARLIEEIVVQETRSFRPPKAVAGHHDGTR